MLSLSSIVSGSLVLRGPNEGGEDPPRGLQIKLKGHYNFSLDAVAPRVPECWNNKYWMFHSIKYGKWKRYFWEQQNKHNLTIFSFIV